MTGGLLVNALHGTPPAGLAPGRFAIVFVALTDKAEARRRQRALWMLGHRPWLRWSGAYVANPSKQSLRLRRRPLKAEADPPVPRSR